MKDQKSEIALNKNFFSEKTSLEKFEEKIKNSIFTVLFVLLKHEEFEFELEMISLVIEIFQFMYYPFIAYFDYIWKMPVFFAGMNSFVAYFQFMIFFSGYTDLFVIAFYLLILLVILVIADIFYVSIIFSQNKVGNMLAIRLLRSVVSYIVTVLFMPIVEFFAAIIECANTDSSGNQLDYYYNVNFPDMICWQGAHFIHATFAILISIIFCIICTIVQNIFYETKTNKNAQNPKTNSKADVFCLMVKIIFIYMYSFVVIYKSLHWVVIIVSWILSMALFFVYWNERPFYDKRVMKAFLTYSALFVWSNSVVLLGKVLQNSNFDGLFYLYFSGIPVVVGIILTLEDDNFSVLLTNINKVQDGNVIIKQIRNFLELVDNDKDRRSRIMLKGYINLHIESCPLEDCSLKKFTASHSSAHPEGIISYLYLHAQSMYQSGISKFPNCTSLRMAYSFFLMERLNNKKLSLLQLKTAEKFDPNFEEQFLIYNFKKIIEDRENEGDDDEEEELDVVTNIAYRSHYVQFKSAIINSASLYTDFWNLLLIPNQDTQEDLTKMNELGSKINEAVEVIRTNFDMMQKYRQNDEEALRIYTDFLTEILNDKEKGAFYKNKLTELDKDKNLNVEIQNTNFDLKHLPTNDEFQYIILSAEPNNLGLITKVSTGICSIFGYTKSEIIGKNVEAIMPELYHKHHRNVLNNQINEYKKNFGKNLSKKPTFTEISVLCKNRSKYLISLDFKVALMTNQDQSEIYFLAKVNPESTHQNLNMKKANNVCYLLINKQFIIQNFTANALNILGLQASSMGTMDISKMIKDFTDDKLEGEERENKGKYDVINKYKIPSNVVWRTLILDKSRADLRKRTLRETNKNVSANSIFNKTPIMRNRYKEENFVMSATESRIAGHTVGFVLKFENSASKTISVKDVKSQKRASAQKNKKKTNKISFKNENEFPKDSVQKDTDLSIPPINNEFYPNNQISFYFNQKEMSFMSNINQKTNLKHNAMKEEAEKKLEKFKMLKEDEENDDSQEENSSDKSDEDSQGSKDSSSNDLSNPSDSNESETERAKRRNGVFNNDDNPNKAEYYRIDTSSIVFLYYDHKKNAIVQIKDKNRQSQVEFKKYEDTKKMQKLSVLRKQTEKRKKEVTQFNEENNIEDDKSINNETIILKQIEYALAKEESQPEIIKLKWMSFMMFLVKIIFAILFLVFFLSHIEQISQTLNMIDYSYQLISNSLISVYFTRELMLTKNPTYTNYLFNTTDEYSQNITSSLLDIFSVTHTLQANIIIASSYLPSSLNETNFNKDILIQTLDSSLKIQDITLSLQTSYSEAYTSLYSLIILPVNELVPNNRLVYFYVYNWLNSILMESQSNAYSYVSLIQTLTDNIKTQYNYFLLFLAPITIVLFIFLIKAHNSVLIRKESYLEVFFEIGVEVIKRAIEKCDKFSKKFCSEDGSDANSTRFDQESIEEASKGHKKQSSNIDSASTEKKRKIRGGESMVITLKIVVILFIFLAFFIFIHVFYSAYLNTFYGYCSFYNVTAYQEIYYLLSYNTLREYVFDVNSNVLNISVSDNINNLLENNYDLEWASEQTADQYFDSLPTSFTSYYNNITYSSICAEAGDLFSNNLISSQMNCSNYFYNSTSYGLFILLTNYIEDIRTLKSNYDNMNNLTAGSNSYSPQSNLTDENNPLKILNDRLLFDLGLVNAYIIRNSYNQTLTNLKATMVNSLNNFKLLYYILFGLFFFLSLYGYFFVWRPFENHLSQTIYKTKNMLSIIPKEVLASLSNINKLLDISSYSFNNINKKKNPHQN